MKVKIGIAEPFKKHQFAITSLPFVIGSGNSCDWQVTDAGMLEKHCSFDARSQKVILQMFSGGGKKYAVVPGKDYALHVGNLFLIVRQFKKFTPAIGEKWTKRILDGTWWLGLAGTKREDGSADGPHTLSDIAQMVTQGMIQPSQYKIYPGQCTAGFQLASVDLGVAQPAQAAIPVAAAAAGSGRLALPQALGVPTHQPQQGYVPPAGIPQGQGASWAYSGALSPSGNPANIAPGSAGIAENYEHTDTGEHICPTCWLRFDSGDAMHIAVHDRCYGDPILGEDAKLRFRATNFNDIGQALDPFGIPCTELACPHCRRALPSGFLDVDHLIFSILGAPQAGKSYFVSVLTRLLQQTLFNEYGISFRDADAAGNAALNEMKATLFSARSPEAAFLAKTVLEGAMYEKFPRFGKMVSLPKPFVFSLSSNSGVADNDCGVVFYDNAGEHFLPGADSSESPGTQHLAQAQAIFFLYDPMSSSEFRARFYDHPDPQFQADVPDNQDVILAESEIRIKRSVGLDRREQISTPMAVMIGKCDAWIDAIGRDSLKPVILDGAVDCSAVEHNSNLIREFMLDICPHIVSNAERLSNRTKYFAVSSFGHTPVRFTDSSGNERLGPDPAQLDPMFVELPFLWAMSQLKPELIPAFT